ncbi:Uncharacterised protein at_DN2091 [Pycnogonum litorale]
MVTTFSTSCAVRHVVRSFWPFFDEEIDLYIFTTERNLEHLAAGHHWFCDGTFDSAPNDYQLYTIHVIAAGTRTIPVVYCLAKNKNRTTYDRIFTYLKDRRNDLAPVSVMVDFEMAAIQSLRAAFPATEVKGCLFHFGQCLWRKIQKLGLQQWYRESPTTRLSSKRSSRLRSIRLTE